MTDEQIAVAADELRRIGSEEGDQFYVALAYAI
jgi:hypothetical protein